MSGERNAGPQVRWDEGTWFVTLPVDGGKTVEASWKPGVTYVVRIREAGTEDWSFGFETLISSFTFVDLKPDTAYEVEVRVKNASGEGSPAFITIRTSPTGASDNVVPFPGCC